MSLKRSHILSLRLSPDEYNRLRQACVAKGIPNLSDLARRAMMAIASGEMPPIDPLSYQLEDLRRQIHGISNELDRLTGLIAQRDRAKGSM